MKPTQPPSQWVPGPPCNAEVKNEWSYAYTLTMCLQGINRGDVSFFTDPMLATQNVRYARHKDKRPIRFRNIREYR
jgi:hypothetical protein